MRSAVLGMCLGITLLGGVSLAQENATGARERALANCPSAVPGAVTRVRDVPGGVQVTVRASNRFAVKQIRLRARQNLRPRRPSSPLVEHTGRATGGGRIGYCPLVRGYTRATVRNLPDGATVTVRPIDRRDLALLRKTARERAAALRGVL